MDVMGVEVIRLKSLARLQKLYQSKRPNKLAGVQAFVAVAVSPGSASAHSLARRF